MRSVPRAGVTLVVMLASAPCMAAQRNADFCPSIQAMRVAAARTGEVQRARIIKPDWETVGCARPDGPEGERFCAAAIDSIGMEFWHVFPWYVRDCLSRAGVAARITTSNDWTGLRNRPRITALRARLRGGVRIDIRFQPSDPSDGARLYGEYRVMIEPPARR